MDGHILTVLLLNGVVLLIRVKNFRVDLISVRHLFLGHGSFLHKWVQLVGGHGDTISANRYTRSHGSNGEVLLGDLGASVCDRMDGWLFGYEEVDKKKIRDLGPRYDSGMKEREKVNKRWEKS